MTGADWRDPAARAVAPYDRRQRASRTATPTAGPMLDDDLLVLVNGWWEPLVFTLPPPPAPDAACSAHSGSAGWRVELDTFAGTVWPADAAIQPVGGTVEVGPRSMVLLVSPCQR